jgi:16S rRNA (guanine966-N2)-methyltransferase
MRVISGEARGRTIQAPPGEGTRPITDRAKESIFNMLTSLGGVVGATVIDLYAGSGSFGIECLSRGAAMVTFVEHGQGAVAALRSNLDTLGFTDRATIQRASVPAVVAALPPADLAFCDPPYAADPWAELLPLLQAEVMVGHADHDIELPAPWVELRRRRYGRSHIVIAERADPAGKREHESAG